MGGFSAWHWLIVAVVAAFLFFGWKQLPDMARSFGRSLRVFKTEIKGMTDDDKARDEARADEPKQLDPRPAPVREAPRADVVRNASAPAAAPAAAPAPAAPRPRPTPSVRRD